MIRTPVEKRRATLALFAEHDGNYSAAARAAGLSRETFKSQVASAQAFFAKQAGAEKPQKPIAGGTLIPPEAAEVRLYGQRFVLTCAQNNTHVHPDFLAALLVYCNARDAQLIVAPFTYNKNAWESSAGKVVAGAEGLWYDPAIVPYLEHRPVRLADDLIFCTDVDTLPTRRDPLSGREDYTKSSSGIFPHIKVRMKSIATMKMDPAKFLYTTGAVTQRNYIQRSAGKVAEFHHTFAALVVEISASGQWFVRQLIAGDDGSFHDLLVRYSNKGTEPSGVAGVTWFDIHIEKARAGLLGLCFAEGGILDQLRPAAQIIHDLTDFEVRNHHNIRNPHFRARMKAKGTVSVEDGMRQSATFLRWAQRPFCETVVAESNHDQALLRWLIEADGHNDDDNALYWHEMNARVLRAIRDGNDDYLAFEDAVRQHGALQNVRFLREDESYVVCGVECGMHGHRGANGARGTPRAYKGMGRRVNRGHEHSAGIDDGVYTSGASAMDMGYNVGMSSWSESFILTYPNGKRQIITVRDSEWKAS